MADKPKRKPRPKSEDSQKSAKAPSVRVITEWTPALLRSAELQAESGNLSLACSVCDWLLTDERIASALDARVEQLLGLIPTFEPSGDKRRSNKAVKALEAGEDWWKAYPESQLALILRWGILLGVAPARHGWTAFPDHGGRLLPMPSFWHPQTLRFDFPRDQWLIRDRNGVELEVTAGDGEWILHTPFGNSRPWAYGVWRSLSRWALLKSYGRSDSGAAGEKASTTVVTSQDGSTYEERVELAQSLIDSGPDRLVVLASGHDMKLLELSASTGEIYRGQIEMANAAIAIRIRGGNLTTEVQSGSFAAAKTQASSNEQPKLRFDAEALSTTLNEQSLSWWAEFNFGDAALAPWPVWPVEPETDRKAEAETLSALGDAIRKLQDVGLNVDLVQIAERFDIPLTKVEQASQGQIFEYHFKYQVVTINEARQRLGLTPIKDGDKPAPVPGTPSLEPNPDPNAAPPNPDEPPAPDDKPPPDKQDDAPDA